MIDRTQIKRLMIPIRTCVASFDWLFLNYLPTLKLQ